jgi:hypothetical protein
METTHDPRMPTNTSMKDTWITAAPQIAAVAANWALRVPGVALMVDWATIAAGSSLFEILPIMNAWYMPAGPRIGK